MGWATGEVAEPRVPEGAGRASSAQPKGEEIKERTSLSIIVRPLGHAHHLAVLNGASYRAGPRKFGANRGACRLQTCMRMHNAWPRRTLPIMVCRRGQTKRRDALFLLRVRWVGAHGEGNPSCPTPTTTRPIEADATLLCWQSRGEIDVFGAFSVLLPSPNSSATGV